MSTAVCVVHVVVVVEGGVTLLLRKQSVKCVNDERIRDRHDDEVDSSSFSTLLVVTKNKVLDGHDGDHDSSSLLLECRRYH